ncbi:chromate efflux transporter [Aliihoeflea sp. PC F10.4]
MTACPQPSVGEVVRVFGRIGLLSFGGPAGQIALMHRELVEERRWLEEARFLHALNYCMVLPGPEAMQLAIYSGWLMRGTLGGLIAGLLFVLPGAILITVLSIVYLVAGEATIVEGLVFGLKAAVLAIVIDALVKVSRRALKDESMIGVAVMAFAAIALLQIPFPVVILAAAFIGAVFFSGKATADDETELQPLPDHARPNATSFVRTTLIWLGIWLVPLAVLFGTMGRGNVFVEEALFFSTMATVTFGGAYAVLAYVAQQAVETYGWLRPDEMLTGLGLAETTPGPLVLVLAFVGFLGGARLSDFDPVTGGIAGALVALWFTFAPSFLFIFAGAPYVETIRRSKRLAAALSAVTAAVVGVIANLAVWFGLHVLFGTLEEVTAGPFRLLVPDPATFDPAAAIIAMGAAVALMVLRVNLIVVLAAASAAGMAWLLS